jgi:hypothetical protein
VVAVSFLPVRLTGPRPLEISFLGVFGLEGEWEKLNKFKTNHSCINSFRLIPLKLLTCLCAELKSLQRQPQAQIKSQFF